jgi:hypothetical protein
MSGGRALLKTPPAQRPLRLDTVESVRSRLALALRSADGLVGAHCIHELWMRGDPALNIDATLEMLWKHAASSIPDWLPMRQIEWLPLLYDVCERFQAKSSGRTNVYLVLLDYRDSRAEPYGIYVGMSRYGAHQRFDQHKAGIRAAGSVLHRGLEVLTGPTAHLQYVSRTDAVRIEADLAVALRDAGLFVQGGH